MVLELRLWLGRASRGSLLSPIVRTADQQGQRAILNDFVHNAAVKQTGNAAAGMSLHGDEVGPSSGFEDRIGRVGGSK